MKTAFAHVPLTACILMTEAEHTTALPVWQEGAVLLAEQSPEAVHTSASVWQEGAVLLAEESPEMEPRVRAVYTDGALRHPGGFSLGRWFSRQVAEAHGGDFHLESPPAWASTVTVKLPFPRPKLRLPAPLGASGAVSTAHAGAVLGASERVPVLWARSLPSACGSKYA